MCTKKGVLNAQECSVAFRAAINAIPELSTTKRPNLLSHYQPSTTPPYRDWETDRKSTRLNSSHITRSRMPSSS